MTTVARGALGALLVVGAGLLPSAALAQSTYVTFPPTTVGAPSEPRVAPDLLVRGPEAGAPSEPARVAGDLLVRTGSDVGWLVALGAAAVAAGAAAVIVTRRRA